MFATKLQVPVTNWPHIIGTTAYDILFQVPLVMKDPFMVSIERKDKTLANRRQTEGAAVAPASAAAVAEKVEEGQKDKKVSVFYHARSIQCAEIVINEFKLTHVLDLYAHPVWAMAMFLGDAHCDCSPFHHIADFCVSSSKPRGATMEAVISNVAALNSRLGNAPRPWALYVWAR